MSNDAMTPREAAILLVSLDVEPVVAQAIGTVVIVGMYPDSGACVVSREARRGSWRATS